MLRSFTAGSDQAADSQGDDDVSQQGDEQVKDDTVGSSMEMEDEDDEEQEEAEEKEKEKKRRQRYQEEERLLRAVSELNVPEITQRLAESKYLNVTAKNAVDYVMAAIRSEKPKSDELKLQVCKILDQTGISFTTHEDDVAGDLPIHAAAAMNSRILFEYCSKFHLDPYRVTNYNGDTPLHVASQYNSLSVISLIQENVGDEEFPKLVLLRNRARLTCYDVACDLHMLPSLFKRKDESSLEHKIRIAKEAAQRSADRDKLQKILRQNNDYLVPVVYYHKDCLDHLAVPTTMQNEFEAANAVGQGETEDNNAASMGGAGMTLRKRKRKGTDPSEAWESPLRLTSIMNHLMPLCEEDGGRIRIKQDFAPATKETLKMAHSNEYVEFVFDLANKISGTGDVIPFTPQVQAAIQKLESHELKASVNCDTGFSEGSMRAATRAAGSVCAAIDAVMKNETRRAFCVVRPPGHHAGRNGLLDEATSCGFCVFNNVMVGAMHALENHGAKKVAIVDLDVHHGNGTEEICKEYHNALGEGAAPRFLFLSTHLHDRTPAVSEDGVYDYEFYPGSGDMSDLPHNVVNIPLKPLWRKRNTLLGGEMTARNWLERFYHDRWGRSEFRRVVEERILPPLRAFHPDLILVSAGFDAAHKDLGNCRFLQKQLDGFDLQREDFFWVASELAKIAEICCDGKMVSVLEGGYGRLCEQTNGGSNNNSSNSAPVASATQSQQQQPAIGGDGVTTATSQPSTSFTGDEAKPTTAATTTTTTTTTTTNNNVKPTVNRRGQANMQIDRDVLARNVQGYIEGLCGRLLPRSLVHELSSSATAQPDKENESDLGMEEDDSLLDNEEDDAENYFVTSDERLLLGVARRSGRVKRQRRSGDLPKKSRRKGLMDDGEGGREANLRAGEVQRENAVRYIRKVRESGDGNYRQFTSIMSSFKNKSMDAASVVAAIKALFAGRPEMIVGFNVFLPNHLRIKDVS